MSPLHLLWICPLCSILGIILIALLVGTHDSEEIVRAYKEDTEHYQFIPNKTDD